jgi:hypothetical protein
MKLLLEKFATIPYQIAFFVITTIVVTAMLYRPLVQYHPAGHKPRLLPMADEAIKQRGQEPIHVKTGFTITDFIKFDPIHNDFSINAVLWFEFNPKTVSAEVVDKFFFTKGDVAKRSEPQIEKKSDTVTRVTNFLRIQFSTIMDYSRFPLDDHRFYLNLTNVETEARNIIFDIASEDFTVDSYLYIAGWQHVGHAVASGYTDTVAGTQTFQAPRIVFSLDLSKQDVRELLLILLPLLLIFYFTIFSFAMKDLGLVFQQIISSIAGLLAYAFVIQTLSPTVGYFMLSDYFFLFFLATVFIIFLVSMLFAVPEHIATMPHLKAIKGATSLALYVLLISVWYYLTNIKGMY